MKKILAAATLACALAAAAQSQTAPRPDPIAEKNARDNKLQFAEITPDITTTCAYTFTSGTGNKFLQYCVTKNGNIVQFASPSGHEHIFSSKGEGYGMCDYDTTTQYNDYAAQGSTSNWQAPTLVSQNATSVVISRKTTDGLYTLTQTITQNAGNAAAQVKMVLKNNTSGSHHVGLARYVDIDADGSTLNSFDYTYRTAWGYNQMGYGLQMFYISGSPSNGAYSQVVPFGPNVCQIFLHTLGPLSATDGSVFIEYDFMLKPNASATVQTGYRSF